MPGFDNLDVDRLGAAHQDGFLAHLAVLPAVGREMAGAAVLELLDEQVVDVGKGMGHAPSHMPVVRKVREARHPRYRQADGIKTGAGQMALQVHAGQLEHPVRVASQQWPPAGAARWCHRPIVAAATGGIGRAQHGQRLDRRCEILQAGDPALAFFTRREAQQIGTAVVIAQFGNIGRSDRPQGCSTPKFEPDRAHQKPAPAHHGDAMPGLPGRRRGVEQAVFHRQRMAFGQKGVHAIAVGLQHQAGRLTQRCQITLRGRVAAELPRQGVAGNARRASPLRPATGHAHAAGVHLPQAVLRMHIGLCKKGVVVAAGPNVSNAPTVAEHLDRLIEADSPQDCGCAGRWRCIGVAVLMHGISSFKEPTTIA